MNYYKFIFYHFYHFFLRIGKGDDPAFKAAAFLSLWVILYLANLLYLSEYFVGKVTIPNFIDVIVALLVIVLNYFLFVYNGHSDKIKKKFDEKTFLSKCAAIVFMTIFLLLPFIGIGIFIYLHKQ